MSYAHSCSNEVLAREGIDTANPFNSKANGVYACSNEVLAREGIDTQRVRLFASTQVLRSNEVLAREGIDTDKVHNVIDVWVTP